MHITALPVFVPLFVAALLVAIRHFSARLVDDLAGIGTAAAVATLCALLLERTVHRPFAYWMGGWRPSHLVTVGISFSVDPIGAGMATFAALLVLAALLYSWHYFDAVHGLFHALMLVFLAAMAGFCLTGDLFNMVVFFELMGAAAYALTAYKIEERGPIQGAINFAISNSVGAYAMFIGIGLLYARTGALNMAQIGAALNGHHADALVIVAMTLIFIGFLTKAAAIPVHFWLADAHAVAPVPVCVLFSGVMVELGIYAIARLYWTIFAGPLGPHAVQLRAILVAIGTVTALWGAVMCFAQSHIKRLLAFSTISHVGVFICAIGLLSAPALGAAAIYIVGHGLTKAALFMLAGVLLHRFATIDEHALHARGRALPVVGALFAIGALLLAAIPPGTTFFGKWILDDAAKHAGYDWLPAIFVVASALTGGAVLRVTAGVFLGWGAAAPGSGGSDSSGADEGRETTAARGRTPPLMVIVPAVLIVAAVAVGAIPGAAPGIERAAAHVGDHVAYTRWVLQGAVAHFAPVGSGHVGVESYVYATISVAGALALAALALFGTSLLERVPRLIVRPAGLALHGLRELHSGHIGDYIAWWTAGAGVLGGASLILLR